MKEKILKSAKGLFQRHGIKQVTLDKIAHNLSISKKTIYECFRNKEEIADEVVGKILEENIRTIDAIRLSNSDPLVKVIEVGKWIYEALKTTNPLFLIEIRKYFSKSYLKFRSKIDSRFLTSFAEIIDEGKQENLFRDDLNSMIMVKYCVELIRTGIKDENYNKDSEAVKKIFEYYILGILTIGGKEKYAELTKSQII